MTLPSVPEPFQWTAQPWGHALTCRALDPIAHLFTTRELQLTPDGWGTLAAGLGVPPARAWRVRQVHGGRVVVAEGDAPHGLVEADALISRDPSVLLAVVVADCVPLLMADLRSGAVAAVHAGWRGTAAGIARETVSALHRELGTRPGDLVAAIGPAIGSCCYEVGTELVDAFAAAGHERYLIDRWFATPPPRRGEPRDPGRKLRLDVGGANRDQLILAGVPEDRIYVAGLCTAMHTDVMTSYRVEKDKASRMAAAIRPGNR